MARVRKRPTTQTYRDWLQRRIRNSEVVAATGKFVTTREAAAARAEAYRAVLRVMERSSLDLRERVL
jgi:hypothetical protein